MSREAKYNWQQPGWPKARVNRAVLGEELKAFAKAFEALKKFLEAAQDAELTAETLTNEAVTTSAIEGVRVDESVVMSSICRALGMTTPPMGFAKDVRAEGVAKMMLSVRSEWAAPISAALIKDWHRDLMLGDAGRVVTGEFRHNPVYVVRHLADGTQEIRFEAPPGEQVSQEIREFVRMWKSSVETPEDIALKAAMLHPHFESIHPFEDGNGRVGRALVAKTIAEGCGAPIILPISTIIARHRAAYYDEINEASRSLDWTNWCAFFIPVLTEMMTSFIEAAKFIAAKRTYLAKYEKSFSDRAKKVILRMFEDGQKGVAAGLSAAKWMRMTKVSKPSATRDLAVLVESGAVLAVGSGPTTHYHLNGRFQDEPIEGLNEGINGNILKLIKAHPGVKIPYLHSVMSVSRATVERAVAALVKAGRVEHRGSKKTGGYWVTGNGEN